MKTAFELINRIKTHETRTVVIGDMLELGVNKLKLHKLLASEIINNGIDEVYSIGSGMKALNTKLRNKNIISRHFRNRKPFENFLENYNPANKIILVKGSRGMHMEEFSEIILSKAGN